VASDTAPLGSPGAWQDAVVDNRIAAALEDKRAELESELAQLSAPSGDSGSIDFGKRVGEGTSMAVDRLSLVASHGQLRVMLADVQRAQAKLAEGSYGRCDRCGVEIPAERLEARPWAVLCITHAARRWP
jgi:DnaK suppressor protein